ncbi:Hypothetical protein SLIV_37392 [Streptomyces lividans TK24]|uniref:Uncharacterized protein n=1 Tax=Streptomyces lividans TK24 TaxID=457428 RepID=A0ABX6TUU3_STRLI|nr:Hypothetical protein SLIV_37392 [Streptomyces lividans TK24]QSJ13975.1 Hypothetical protein SLIVDG2_37392 [Streptomyces lividans]QTD74885.1 Hypothetical protein SLIVYQS_37392 [Streptomyces lividans TK24] [Streptomyces lividans]
MSDNVAPLVPRSADVERRRYVSSLHSAPRRTGVSHVGSISHGCDVDPVGPDVKPAGKRSAVPRFVLAATPAPTGTSPTRTRVRTSSGRHRLAPGSARRARRDSHAPRLLVGVRERAADDGGEGVRALPEASGLRVCALSATEQGWSGR